MGILKLLGDTSMEQLNDMHDRQKAAGLAYLQGPGNRRRGVRADAGQDSRRSADRALPGRRAADIACSGRRSSNVTDTGL